MAMNALEFYRNLQDYVNSDEYLNQDEETRNNKLKKYNAHLQKLQQEESADMDDEEFEAYKAQFKPYEANKQISPQGRSHEFARRIQEAKKSEAWENLPDNEKAKYNQVIGQKYRELRLAEGLPIEAVDYNANQDANQRVADYYNENAKAAVEYLGELAGQHWHLDDNQPKEVKDLTLGNAAKAALKSAARIPGSVASSGLGFLGGLTGLAGSATGSETLKDLGAVMGTGANTIDAVNQGILPPEQKAIEGIKDIIPGMGDRTFGQKVLTGIDQLPEQLGTWIMPGVMAKTAKGAVEGAKAYRLAKNLQNLEKVSKNVKKSAELASKLPKLGKLSIGAKKSADLAQFLGLHKLDPEKAAKYAGTLGSMGLELSEMFKTATTNEGEVKDPLHMATMAGIAGLLEDAVPSKLFRMDKLKPATRAMLRRDLGKGFWKSSKALVSNLGKDTIRNIASEGGTELLQTYLEQAAANRNAGGSWFLPYDDAVKIKKLLDEKGFEGVIEEAKHNERLADIIGATVLGGISGGLGNIGSNASNYISYNTSPEGYLDRYRENREALINGIDNAKTDEERNQKQQQLDQLDADLTNWKLSNPDNAARGDFDTIYRSFEEMANAETSDEDLKDAFRTLSRLSDDSFLNYTSLLQEAGWENNPTFYNNLDKLIKYREDINFKSLPKTEQNRILKKREEAEHQAKIAEVQRIKAEEEARKQAEFKKQYGDLEKALLERAGYMNLEKQEKINQLLARVTDEGQKAELNRRLEELKKEEAEIYRRMGYSEDEAALQPNTQTEEQQNQPLYYNADGSPVYDTANVNVQQKTSDNTSKEEVEKNISKHLATKKKLEGFLKKAKDPEKVKKLKRSLEGVNKKLNELYSSLNNNQQVNSITDSIKTRQAEEKLAKKEQENESLRNTIAGLQSQGNLKDVKGQPLPNGKSGFVGNRARLKAGDIDTECDYAIVELSDLQTLSDEENPRQRKDRQAYANTVSERARNLDPDLLIDNSVGAQNGPIVVDQNLKVESGNGRTLSLREAYANRKGEGEYSGAQTDEGYGRADLYRNKLIAEAPKYGISSEQVMQMKEPVLVRIRVADSNINAQDFWAKANNSQQEAMSSTETAMVDGEKIKPLLKQFEAIGDIRAKSNLDFVKSFLEKICSPYELNSMFTADGKSLSETGEKRINNAIISAAYGDSEIVSLLTELGNEDVQTILNGLAMAAPDTAKLMGEAQQGFVYDVDYSKDLADAIRTIKNLRQNPETRNLIKQLGSLGEAYLRQGTLGDDGLSPTARLFIGVLGNINNKETISNFLRSVNNSVRAEGSPNQLGMFEANTKPSDEVFVERAISNMGFKVDAERYEKGPSSVASNDDFHAEDAQGRRYSLGQTENGKLKTKNLSDEERQIKHRAESNGTYLRAPNGKDSSLNEDQWIEARTKEFKDKFGDWELVSNADKISKISVKSIKINNTLDKVTLETQAQQFGEITNTDKNIKATIPVSSIGKIIKHKGFNIASIFGSLKNLFETSVLAFSEPEILKQGHKQHNNIEQYHHYINIFTDGKGNTYYIRFTLHQEKSKKGYGKGKNFIHSTFISDVNVYEAKNNKTDDAVMTPILTDTGRTASPVDYKLKNFFSSVEKFDRSKLDENGEPKAEYLKSASNSSIVQNENLSSRQYSLTDSEDYRTEAERIADDGTVVTKEEFEDYINSLNQTLDKNAGISFEIYDSVEEFNKSHKNKVPSNANAFYSNGKIVLIRDNIKTLTRLKQVAAHELVGHAGIERLLGGRYYGIFLKSIRKLARRDSRVGKLLAQVKRNYGDFYAPESYQIYEELGAHLAELYARKPESFSDRVHSYIRKLKVMFRNALRNWGVDIEFNQIDLEDIFAKAREAVETTNVKESSTNDSGRRYSIGSDGQRMTDPEKDNLSDMWKQLEGEDRFEEDYEGEDFATLMDQIDGKGKSENGKLKDSVRFSLSKIESLTEDDVKDMLYKASINQISGYIPVRRNTPKIIVDFAKDFDEKAGNYPLIIEASKIPQIFDDSENWDPKQPRPHNYNEDIFIALMKSLDDPAYIVLQNKNKNKKKPDAKRFGVVTKFYDGKKKHDALAVIEFKNNKEGDILNGYPGGVYNINVTSFDPDDIQKYLYGEDSEGNKNIVIYDKIRDKKKYDESQRESGNSAPSHLNDSPYASIITKNSDNGNQSEDTDSNGNPYGEAPEGRMYSISPVWTGSAADYDQPSTDFINTGEGAQVFGWGLYASSSEGVGRRYAEQDFERKTNIESNAWESMKVLFFGSNNIEDGLNRINEDIQKNGEKPFDDWTISALRNSLPLAKAELIDDYLRLGKIADSKSFLNQLTIELGKEYYGYSKSKDDEIVRLQKYIKNNYDRLFDFEFKPDTKKPNVSRNLYKQTAFPGKEENLLDWYENIDNERRKHVYSEFIKHIQETYGDWDWKPLGYNIAIDYAKERIKHIDKEGNKETGEELYNNLQQQFRKFSGEDAAEATSEFLYSIGIDGIKYPINSTRGNTSYDKGFNIVVFNDKDLRVDEHMRYSLGSDGKLDLNGERYSPATIEDHARSWFMDAFEFDMDGDTDTPIDIVNCKVVGSRAKGTSKADSDLDVVLEYDDPTDSWSEDSVYNILNEVPMELNGVKVDINPIKKEDSGTLEDWLERNYDYDKNEEQKENRRFSLSSPVERTKNLIAVHNIHEGKLQQALDLGGFPMPSIAITKDSMGHNNYGEYSIVFGSDTIDPKKSRYNKVYSGDAYTPMFPNSKIGYKVDEEKLDKKLNLLNQTLKDIDREIYDEFSLKYIGPDDLKSDLNYGDTFNLFKYNKLYQAAFLNNKGINFEIAYKENETVDHYKTSDNIDEALKGHEEEYEHWIRDFLDGIILGKGLRNDKDLFTPSGNRRKFESLYDDFTLNNIVKSMRKKGKGVNDWGMSNIFGSSTYEYSNLDRIRKDSVRRMKRVDEDEYNKIRKGILDRFSSIANPLPNNSGLMAYDDARNVLCEAVAKYESKGDIERYIREQFNGWAELKPDTVDELIALRDEIRAMPTGYFEAKPERAVDFDEIAYIVAPDNANPKVIQQLQDKGIDVVQYSRGDSNDRLRVLNESADKHNVRFSLAGTKAKTANIATLDEARKMLADGADKKEVWAKTGWYIAKDGKPRFEISDKSFRLKKDALRAIEKIKEEAKNPYYQKPMYGTNVYDYPSKTFNLKDVISHRRLLSAYDLLPEIEFLYNPHDVGKAGAYTSDRYNSRNGGKISINLASPSNSSEDGIKETIIHELQHLIQHIEGFAKGSNPAAELDKLKREHYEEKLADKEKLNEMLDSLNNATAKSIAFDYNYLYDKYLDEELDFINGNNEKLDTMVDINYQLKDLEQRFVDAYGSNEPIKTIKRSVEFQRKKEPEITEAREKYRKSYGEGEARVAEKRLDYEDFDRAEFMPEEDFDYNVDDSIIEGVEYDDNDIDDGAIYSSEDNGRRYSLCEFIDSGQRFVDVKADQSIFDGLSDKQKVNKAISILKNKFGNKVIGIDNRVYVNSKQAKEYGYPPNSIKDKEIINAKMRASTELDNLVDAGTNFRTELDGKDGHIHLDAKNFEYFDVLFKVGDQFYKGVINIKNNNRGRLFYDITKIENVTKDQTDSTGNIPAFGFLRDISMPSEKSPDNSSITENSENGNIHYSLSSDIDNRLNEMSDFVDEKLGRKLDKKDIDSLKAILETDKDSDLELNDIPTLKQRGVEFKDWLAKSLGQLIQGFVGDTQSKADRKKAPYLWQKDHNTEPRVETPFEISRRHNIEEGMKIREEEDRLVLKHLDADKNFFTGLIRKITKPGAFQDWMLKKASRILAPFQMMKPVENLLFTVAENIMWDEAKQQMVIAPYRDVELDGNNKPIGYKYDPNEKNGRLALDIYNNSLNDDFKAIIKERSIANNKFREDFVKRVVPYEQAKLYLAKFARKRLEGASKRIVDGNDQQAYSYITKLKGVIDDIDYRNLISQYDQIRNVPENQLGRNSAHINSIIGELTGNPGISSNGIDGKLRWLTTNKGLYGYAHHLVSIDPENASGKPFNALSKLTHPWIETIAGDRRGRKGNETDNRSLLKADLERNRKEAEAEAANRWMEDTENQYGITIEEAKILEAKAQKGEGPGMPEGYEHRHKVVANFGKFRGKIIYLPDETFEAYQMVRDNRSLDTMKQFGEFMQGLNNINGRINEAMLYHPGKAMRDLMSGPFHLLEFLRDWSMKHPTEIADACKAMLHGIKNSASPEYWQSHTPESMGEYSESVFYQGADRQSPTVKLLDSVFKYFQKAIPVGQTLEAIRKEVNLSGGADIPLKRIFTTIGEELADKRGLQGQERDRFIYDMVNDYAFDTGDLPEIIAWLRGKKADSKSQALGMISRATVPFMGYATRMLKQMLTDPVTKGAFPLAKRAFGKADAGSNIRSEISEISRPFFWLLLKALISAGLGGLLPEPTAEEIQDMPGLPPSARTHGRFYIGDSERGERFMSTKGLGQLETASLMSDFLHGKSDIIDFSSEFLTIHPIAKYIANLSGMTSEYDRKIPFTTQTGKLLAGLILPEITTRFTDDVAKLTRAYMEKGTTDRRRQTFIQAFFEKLLGIPRGQAVFDKEGHLRLSDPALESLKMLGVNIREIPFDTIEETTRAEASRISNDAKRIKKLEDYRASKYAPKTEMEFLKQDFGGDFSSVEEAEKAYSNLAERERRLVDTATKLHKKGHWTDLEDIAREKKEAAAEKRKQQNEGKPSRRRPSRRKTSTRPLLNDDLGFINNEIRKNISREEEYQELYDKLMQNNKRHNPRRGVAGQLERLLKELK